MYLSPDDAKTDVILAAAATVLGALARGFVSGLPLYPRQGVLALLLDVLWVVALTALVPVLLARHRRDGVAAFGLGPSDGGWRAGLVLAVPAVVAGVLLQLLLPTPTARVVLGRLAITGSLDPLAILLDLAFVAAFTLGALVLVGFLAVRGRDGYPRSPEVSLTELVRTFGLGAVVAAGVVGLLRSLGAGSFAATSLNVLALVAILLLTDRLVPAGVRVPRTTVAVPVIVIAVAHVFAFGGIFGGDLPAGLYTAALAVGATIAVAALTQTSRRGWAALPLLLAIHWWPTCLSPLSPTLAPGIC